MIFSTSVSSKEDAFTIFRDASILNMTESGYVWIVTEQALNANNTPDGVIGLQLVHANNEKQHIRVNALQIEKLLQWALQIHLNLPKIEIQDSVYVLAAAVKELINNETITEAPKACEDTDVIWESGRFSI